jgi:hypothetical protein
MNDMKFAVTASNGYVKHYEDKLKNFNLTKKIAYDEICNDEEETCEIYYIKLDSIEDLIRLKELTGHNIILKNDYFDELSNYYQELAIEIYDSYRE